MELNYFKGIGEIIIGKTEWLDNLSGNEIVNHPVMMKVYDRAKKHDLPVTLHCNIHYQQEFEEVLRRFPDVKFIWAHCGANPLITGIIDKVDYMLTTYQNIIPEISYDIWEYEIIDRKTGEIDKKWIELIEKFCNRFVMGFDLCGEYSGYENEVGRTLKLFEMLYDETVKNLSSRNIKRFLDIS